MESSRSLVKNRKKLNLGLFHRAAGGSPRANVGVQLCKDASTYLCHEPVGAGALLVLEDDVLVVIGDEVLESGVVPADAAFGEPAGSQGVLRNVGHMLFEDERGEFSRASATTGAPSRAAAQRAQDEGQQKHSLGTPPHRRDTVIPGRTWVHASPSRH